MTDYTEMINSGLESGKGDMEIILGVARVMFESEYGSVICSLEDGKRETKKRIETAMSFASGMLQLQKKLYAMRH